MRCCCDSRKSHRIVIHLRIAPISAHIRALRGIRYRSFPVECFPVALLVVVGRVVTVLIT